MHEDTTVCRACGSNRRHEVLSLGNMPHSDRMRTPAQLQEREPRFPLTVLFCEDCSLVQIRENVSPDFLFGDEYLYFSSFSDAWVKHCAANAEELVATRALGSDSLVVELACNDGYMLRSFQANGVGVLGIDPAPGPVAAARDAGIEVIEDFFTNELAGELRHQGRRADVVIANNVLAHVPDLCGFVGGIRQVLKDSGVAVIEAPYVGDLVDACEFDTIYHQHHCYFSVTALAQLFERQGLSLNEVRRLPTHGGSLRLYVEPVVRVGESVTELLAEERARGIDRIGYYRDFARRVQGIQADLVALLSDLKQRGSRIAAYGAAAKGAILLNSSGIGPDLLDYVVDRNRHKHGKFMPGVDVPIQDPARLLDDPPDYLLVLAWNHKDEIFRQQAEYRRRGGKFIVPIPNPEIV